MNDAISAAKRPNLWPLLRAYSLAVAKYWYAIVVGIILSWVDFVERSLGTWWIFRPWVRLVTITLGFAAAQFLAYRDLHLAHLDEKQRTASKHLAEIAELRGEVESLKSSNREFDAKHLQLVQDKLIKLSPTSKKLVIYLLHHGKTEQDALATKSQPLGQFCDAIQQAKREGLVNGTATGNPARPGTLYFWEINPAFEAALQELLGKTEDQ